MLNPVEGCIADVKRGIQTEFAIMLNLATLPHGTRTGGREQLLLQALTATITLITPQLVQAHQNHILTQFPGILAGQDVSKVIRSNKLFGRLVSVVKFHSHFEKSQ
jgi:hypothetical protein